MSKFTILPGNIAAVVHVKMHYDGSIPGYREATYIFMADNKLPENAALSPPFESLPLEVRAAVNKHFGTVFALPVERRGAYLRSCVPFDVEV